MPLPRARTSALCFPGAGRFSQESFLLIVAYLGQVCSSLPVSSAAPGRTCVLWCVPRGSCRAGRCRQVCLAPGRALLSCTCCGCRRTPLSRSSVGSGSAICSGCSLGLVAWVLGWPQVGEGVLVRVGACHSTALCLAPAGSQHLPLPGRGLFSGPSGWHPGASSWPLPGREGGGRCLSVPQVQEGARAAHCAPASD